MVDFQRPGFYIGIDYDTLAADNQVTFNFSQVFGNSIERHQLVVSWNDIYLAHYDPTILAVCLVHDREQWLVDGTLRIIGVDRCTNNYRCATDEVVEVFDLPSLMSMVWASAV